MIKVLVKYEFENTYKHRHFLKDWGFLHDRLKLVKELWRTELDNKNN
jgi:hypothetical protein